MGVTAPFASCIKTRSSSLSSAVLGRTTKVFRGLPKTHGVCSWCLSRGKEKHQQQSEVWVCQQFVPCFVSRVLEGKFFIPAFGLSFFASVVLLHHLLLHSRLLVEWNLTEMIYTLTSLLVNILSCKCHSFILDINEVVFIGPFGVTRAKVPI